MPAVTTRETSPPAWVSIRSRLRSRRMVCPHLVAVPGHMGCPHLVAVPGHMGCPDLVPVPVGDHDQLADIGLAHEGALGFVELGEAEGAVQQGPDPTVLDVAGQSAEGGASSLRGAVQLQVLNILHDQTKYTHRHD